MSNCFFLPQSVSSENSPEDPERLQAAVCYSPITLDQAGHPLPTSFSRSLALAGNQQIAQGQGVHLCALEEVDGLFGAADNRLIRSEEHTSELQSRLHLVCRLLLEKKKSKHYKCGTIII